MKTTATVGKSKKQGLGKGIDSLIPPQTARIEESERIQTDEQRIGEAVGRVAMTLSENINSMNEHAAERMLRMIVSLCQSELKGGYRS